jgi:hypothetical protein
VVEARPTLAKRSAHTLFVADRLAWRALLADRR